MGSLSSSKYGYSNARVKALKSRLISAAAIEDISKVDTGKEMIEKLMDTGLKEFLKPEDQINEETIEIALSEDLARSAEKLIKIVPPKWSQHIRMFVAKWDISNISMMIKAKSSNIPFSDLSRLLIPSSTMSIDAMIQSYDQPSVEAMLSRLSAEVPHYYDIIEECVSAYRRKNSPIDAIFALDRSYYNSISRSIEAISTESRDTSNMIRYEIEARNIMLIVRAKRHGISGDEINDLFIPGGITDKRSLIAIMESSGGLEELPSKINSFDLFALIDQYRTTGNMYDIEIGIKRQIFKRNERVMRYTVLSLGTVLGYLYLKESEIMRIRDALKRKMYQNGDSTSTRWLYE